MIIFFFFQAEDGIRYLTVTGVQTCALPISTNATAAISWLQGHWHLWPHNSAWRGVQRRNADPRLLTRNQRDRSGERRVGEEGRTRGAPDPLKKKKNDTEGLDEIVITILSRW